MHSEPDEYLRAYNQVVEFLKDPSRSWGEGEKEKTTKLRSSVEALCSYLGRSLLGFECLLGGWDQHFL